MKLTEQEVKGFFIKCANTSKSGLYHGEGHDALDLLEFANYITEYVSHHEYMRGKKDAYKRCIKLAAEINPQVSSYLLDKRDFSE